MIMFVFQAQLAKSTGNFTLMAIGVGNQTVYSELVDIASVNEQNKSLVYEVGDFAALQTLNKAVATVACGCKTRSRFTCVEKL